MKRPPPIALLTLLTLVAVAGLWYRSASFSSLWMTPDQQGRWYYDHLKFPEAMETFESPSWKGLSAYHSGKYIEAAAAFAQIPNAEGLYNMGNSFMKSRDYGKAIQAYEWAVAEAPGWSDAEENLKLARYVLEYIERTRESSDTGDETELGADEFKFDNTKGKGLEITITEQSTLEQESAEKWMRSVDTQTRDFLRIRFMVEQGRKALP